MHVFLSILKCYEMLGAGHMDEINVILLTKHFYIDIESVLH